MAMGSIRGYHYSCLAPIRTPRTDQKPGSMGYLGCCSFMCIFAYIIGEPEKEPSYMPEFLIFREWCAINPKALREMVWR
jgi:hypothetical protein